MQVIKTDLSRLESTPWSLPLALQSRLASVLAISLLTDFCCDNAESLFVTPALSYYLFDSQYHLLSGSMLVLNTGWLVGEYWNVDSLKIAGLLFEVIVEVC